VVGLLLQLNLAAPPLRLLVANTRLLLRRCTHSMAVTTRSVAPVLLGLGEVLSGGTRDCCGVVDRVSQNLVVLLLVIFPFDSRSSS
jgi:hypothetical protein